jgi:hypothetical protein
MARDDIRSAFCGGEERHRLSLRRQRPVPYLGRSRRFPRREAHRPSATGQPLQHEEWAPPDRVALSLGTPRGKTPPALGAQGAWKPNALIQHEPSA